MLRRFSVEGFKNFEKKISIDFDDVQDYKFHHECVTDGLLNTAIIYGKNAVGKSNFGLALFDIVSHLTINNVTPGLYDYYLNVNNKNGYASFEYEFQFGEDEILYGYNKTEKDVLSSEFLMINGTVMFHNSGSDIWENNGLIELAPNLNWKYDNEMSTLKYFLFNSSLDSNHPLSKLMKFLNTMLWFRSLDENRFIGYKEKSRDYFTFMIDKQEYINEFNALLRQSGVNDSVVAKKDTDGETRLYFDTKTPMPFMKVASSGTKALYTFYYWYKTASDVSFMYIDEFDAFYHYELSETIVSMLEKMGGFQKILTSHNTNLLSNRIMRPDCYLILTKDRLISLANATERELREGHNLEKLYMSGEFDG
jgi:AAA15 family ATPase/GTPase